MSVARWRPVGMEPCLAAELPGRQAQARHPSLPPLPMSSWLCDLGQSLNLSVLGFGSAL